MELFSKFCTICCKDTSHLYNLCEEDQEYLKNIYLAFIGQAEAVHMSNIYICTLCSERLLQIEKFRGKCLSNFLQLRQLYIKTRSLYDQENDSSTKFKEFLNASVTNLHKNADVIKKVQSTCHTSANITKTDTDTCILDVENIKTEFECKNEGISHSRQFHEMVKVKEHGILLKQEIIDMEVENNLDVINNSENIQMLFYSGNKQDKEGKATSKDFIAEAIRVENASATAVDNVSEFEANKTMKRFTCKLCRKSFNSRWHANVHERVHMGLKPYVCDTCNRGFAQYAHLTRHERLHDKSRPYCAICEKTFRSDSSFAVHRRLHKGHSSAAAVHEYGHKCRTCHKSFISSTHLDRHERIHKLYECPICNETFKLSYHKTVHERSHYGLGRFKCSLCAQGFHNKSDLIMHARAHKGGRIYKCCTCQREFINSCNLKKHKCAPK